MPLVWGAQAEKHRDTRHFSTFWRRVCWHRQTLLLMACLPGWNRLMPEEPVVEKLWFTGGSPSPVFLSWGLLSWSFPQKTRDVAFGVAEGGIPCPLAIPSL